MKTYEDYKSEHCDICNDDFVSAHISSIALCPMCENEIFARGGGIYKECCCDLYCDRDHKDWMTFSEDKAGIPALYQELLQKSIGKVTSLPIGYFDFWEFDGYNPIERKIPALAGMSYAIQYHEDGEGETLLLESKLSKSKATCEFFLFYAHDYKGSCEEIQQQLLSGEY